MGEAMAQGRQAHLLVLWVELIYIYIYIYRGPEWWPEFLPSSSIEFLILSVGARMYHGNPALTTKAQRQLGFMVEGLGVRAEGF